MFGGEYGFLWYKPYEARKVYAAIGDSGNIIYVNRENHIAVGVTGTFKPRIFDRVEFTEKQVLPLIECQSDRQKSRKTSCYSEIVNNRLELITDTLKNWD